MLISLEHGSIDVERVVTVRPAILAPDHLALVVTPAREGESRRAEEVVLAHERRPVGAARKVHVAVVSPRCAADLRHASGHHFTRAARLRHVSFGDGTGAGLRALTEDVVLVGAAEGRAATGVGRVRNTGHRLARIRHGRAAVARGRRGIGRGAVGAGHVVHRDGPGIRRGGVGGVGPSAAHQAEESERGELLHRSLLGNPAFRAGGWPIPTLIQAFLSSNNLGFCQGRINKKGASPPKLSSKIASTSSSGSGYRREAGLDAPDPT